jgi:hypothetical protein
MTKCMTKCSNKIILPKKGIVGPPGKGLECDANHNLFAGDVTDGTGASNATIYGCGSGVEVLNSNYTQSTIIGSNCGLALIGGGHTIIGSSCGQSSGEYSVAIGHSAGNTSQGKHCVAIGLDVGKNNQGDNSVAIGYLSATTNQSHDAIAIGVPAAASDQGARAIAIGMQAGNISQSADSISIGTQCSNANQGQYSITMGFQAGFSQQGTQSVAFGYRTAYTSQGINSIAIGSETAFDTQGDNCVAIGYKAGRQTQASNSVCIGTEAGMTGTVDHGLYFHKNMAVLGSGIAVNYDNDTGQMGPATSSLRFKENIKPHDLNSSIIYDLSLKSFNYKNKANTSYGYIAEEIEKLEPKLVVYSLDDKGNKLPYGVRYDQINLLAIEEIKILKDEIISLKNEIKDMNKK